VQNFPTITSTDVLVVLVQSPTYTDTALDVLRSCLRSVEGVQRSRLLISMSEVEAARNQWVMPEPALICLATLLSGPTCGPSSCAAKDLPGALALGAALSAEQPQCRASAKRTLS